MTVVSDPLDKELETYEQMRQDLETHHMGKWVLVHGGVLVGIFDTFETAAESAVKKFGRGPYLIKQVGEQPITIPASVAYFQYGHSKMRV